MRAIERPFGDSPAGSPLFVGESCALFRHRCHAGHPDLGDRIAVQAPVVLFPGSAFRLVLAGGSQLVADRNSIVLLGVGDSFERHALPGQRADSHLLAVDPGVLRSALGFVDTICVQDAGQDALRACAVSSTPGLLLAMSRVVSTLRGSASGPQATEDRLREILAHVVRLCLEQKRRRRPGTNTSRAGGAVLRAKSLLATRMGEPPSLEEVAAAAHLSTYHLTRVFKRHCGTSIHDYWIRLKMAQSLSLLRDSSLSIAGVSNRLGFCAHSHFSSTFRRHFGITPRGFQATLRQDAADRRTNAI